MATQPAAPAAITFIVPGQPRVSRGAGDPGAASQLLPELSALGARVKDSVQVGAQRGGGGLQRLTAIPGQDVIVLHIDHGPALVLHPQTAMDLMRSQTGVTRSGVATRGAALAAEVEVPVELRWQGLEDKAIATRGAARGLLGGAILQAFEVVTGLFQGQAAAWTAEQIVKRVDSQVDPGVYRLDPQRLDRLKDNARPVATIEASAQPSLVMVHGTFVETTSTFGKLWTHHAPRLESLFAAYGGRVYALDHPTLGATPIGNALTLAKACPPGTRLHLVTHSRGGLVAEALARVCGDPRVDAAAAELFAGPEFAQHRADLAELARVVRERSLRVDRIVRVACPARGTLLASKRLDAYVSVFKWTLELAGAPVLPELVEFLGAVAQQRADPTKIPGLAAQVPDNPFITWLHAAETPLPGQLRVLAGDIAGDSVTSWLKTLLSDAYYRTDNDLVVQTSSMYGGAPREAGATFVLEQGGDVSHFNYFLNARSAGVICDALVQDAPQDYQVIGPLSAAGDSSTGVRARRDGTPAAERPAVFVLPGILGSNLAVDGKRIWLGWRLVNGLKRLEYRAGAPDGVTPDGPIGRIYDSLMDYLAQTHEVIAFAYDWRRPLQDEARRLAGAVGAAMAARVESGMPVRLVAHSMGGVLARTMQVVAPEVWDRLMAHPQARLLMLGTPNGGSWAPMQVLSGDDSFGNTLVAFGAPFQDRQARTMMAQFPGFIQLQADLLADSPRPLARAETWKALADEDLRLTQERNWWHTDGLQESVYAWGVPQQPVLDQAVELRRVLDQQREQDLPRWRDKLLLVVGHAKFTPAGYEVGNQGFVYLNAPEAGDGRVTLSSALLPGVKTWRLDSEHGDLPCVESAFPAFLDLLQDGKTTALAPLGEATGLRGAAIGGVADLVRSRPSRQRQGASIPQSLDDTRRLPADAGPADGERAAASMALRIRVVNGDLKFVRQPLMVGHYRSLALTGTEAVVNQLIGGTMADALALGQYPDSAGAHQIFANNLADRDNPLQLPRPGAVIVVGLGQEGKLRASELSHTVRQAVIAWSLRLVEAPGVAPASFEIAATLIGSGGSGISAGQAAQQIAMGVRDANEQLSQGLGPRRQWPRVGDLVFVELYLDRASDAWRALQVQALSAPGSYQVVDHIASSIGALRRPLDAGYRGAEYDLISAASSIDGRGGQVIAYTLDTRRARTEVRAQATQSRLLEQLVSDASNDRQRDAQIGRTLFQLLVPPEMEPFLGGSTEMLLELDDRTAAIPWELLDSGHSARPWAIRCKLLRKLRTDTFRTHVTDANPDASVLVLGEPRCDDPAYPRLPSAREEALVVADGLRRGLADGERNVELLVSASPELPGPDARTVINKLMERDWRIVHVSGHGEPPLPDGDARGVVLSNGTFLGPREIESMRVVPELVFVNCCHLARLGAGAESAAPVRPVSSRPRFAAGVAEALIKIGVRCVVAAGWAVGDAEAQVFASTFYGELLKGRRFVDAVARARETAWDEGRGGNTWAAYQCYGDPNWYLRSGSGDAQAPRRELADEFSGVASAPGLALALETLVIRSNFQGAKAQEQRTRIRHLEARFGPQWGAMGAVAEAFGAAWDAAGDRDKAVQWFARAVEANDGSASLKASEQFGNLSARRAWARFDAVKTSDAAAKAAAGQQALDELAAAIGRLLAVAALAPTMERLSLLGSAYKREAMVLHALGRDKESAAALERMRLHYLDAESAGRRQGSDETYYPSMNGMAAALALHAGAPGWAGLDPVRVAEARRALATKSRDDPDFFSVIGLTELDLYEALSANRLADRLPSLELGYRALHARARTVRNWQSAYDQARFVLDRYTLRVPRQAAAAQKLLDLLADFAK